MSSQTFGGRRKIGLMGGTFDPIHFGHLFIAEAARVHCALDEVLFFPNNQPAPILGKSTQATPETRLRLVEMAIAGNEFFRASRVELDRSGPSYTFDTLQEMRKSCDAQLFTIVGADSIKEVLTWHRGVELFDLCRFVAVSRPGYQLDEAREKLSPRQLERVIWLEAPGLHIASRDLRKRVRDGLPVRYLVPDEVAGEITKQKLYRGEENND